MVSEDLARLVSVVIPTRNRIERLARCLKSVYESDYGHLEVIVVDDASDEPVGNALSSRFRDARFLRNERRRLLACSRNLGAAASNGSYLFFLDDDNILAPDAIRLLVHTLDTSERVAVSAPLIFYLSRPTEVWTSSIVRTKFPGFYRLKTEIPKTEAQTFSFHNSFMVKRAVFWGLHGFDCSNLPIRFSEVDFAHKLKEAGFAAVVNPLAKDWHDLGWTGVHIDSERAYYTERNRIIVLKRYYARRDLAFYAVCLLPFIGAYYLIHHPLSTSDSRAKTASRFLRGTLAGLAFRDPSDGSSDERPPSNQVS